MFGLRRTASNLTLRAIFNQNRNFHVTKVVEKGPTVGLVGMGHVGKAVCNNLLRLDPSSRQEKSSSLFQTYIKLNFN